MQSLAEKMDRDNPDASSRVYIPLACWMINLFEFLFSRNLFTTVESFGIVAYNQVQHAHYMNYLIDWLMFDKLFALGLAILLYPVRMTATFYRFWWQLKSKLNTYSCGIFGAAKPLYDEYEFR